MDDNRTAPENLELICKHCNRRAGTHRAWGPVHNAGACPVYNRSGARIGWHPTQRFEEKKPEPTSDRPVHGGFPQVDYAALEQRIAKTLDEQPLSDMTKFGFAFDPGLHDAPLYIWSLGDPVGELTQGKTREAELEEELAKEKKTSEDLREILKRETDQANHWCRVAVQRANKIHELENELEAAREANDKLAGEIGEMQQSLENYRTACRRYRVKIQAAREAVK